MAFKIVVFFAALAAVNAGYLGSSVYGAGALGYGAAPLAYAHAPATSYAYNNKVSVRAPVAAAYAAPAVSYAAPAVSYAAHAAPAVSYAAPAVSYAAHPAPALSYAATPALGYSAGLRLASPLGYAAGYSGVHGW